VVDCRATLVLKPRGLQTDICFGVQGQRLSLALAYAANEAYEHADENRELIDGVVHSLGSQVDIDEAAFAELVARFFQVLDTNRTAPAVVRIMAYADAARVCRAELASPSHGRRARRALRRESERATNELLKQVAETLDGLLAEAY
jgi:hypothetical protein